MQKELDIDALLGSGPNAGSLKPTVAPRLPFAAHRPGALSQRAQVQGGPAYRPAARPAVFGRSSEPEDYGGDDGGAGDYGYDEGAADEGGRLGTTGPGTPPASAPTQETAAAAEDAGASAGAAAVESSQPKLSLSKGGKKLKASEPSKAAVSAASSVWGYKPDLASTAGTALSTFGAVEVAAPVVGPAVGEAVGVAAGTAAGAVGKVDPRSWLLRTKVNPADASGATDMAVDGATAAAAQGEEYVNMFWLDAAENNGIVYLFGKVPLIPEAGAPASAPRKFVSCCVAVHGSERNLFVLPRLVPDTFKEDGTPARLGMADVYKELSTLLGEYVHYVFYCLAIAANFIVHISSMQCRILCPGSRARASAARP